MIADRLLLDEMFASRISDMLTERDVDCLAVCDSSDLAGRGDDEILEASTSTDRVLVTNNVGDFEILRRRRTSAGIEIPEIIYTDDSTFPRNRHFADLIAAALENAARNQLARRDGGVHWLQQP